MAQVVIAARGGPGAKSRLADLLAPDGRAALVEVMLRDMLAAAPRAPRCSGLWVVTPTPALAALARSMGARVIAQSDPGDLNAAFRQAMAATAEAAPYDAVALLPGDLPLLEPGDLDAALALAEAHPVALAPSTDGGTGALVLRAGARLEPRFGPGSFALHRDQAEGRGYPVAVVEAESLAHDLDRVDDVAWMLRQARPGHTTAFLSARCPRLTPP